MRWRSSSRRRRGDSPGATSCDCPWPALTGRTPRRRRSPSRCTCTAVGSSSRSWRGPRRGRRQCSPPATTRRGSPARVWCGGSSATCLLGGRPVSSITDRSTKRRTGPSSSTTPAGCRSTRPPSSSAPSPMCLSRCATPSPSGVALTSRATLDVRATPESYDVAIELCLSRGREAGGPPPLGARLPSSVTGRRLVRLHGSRSCATETSPISPNQAVILERTLTLPSGPTATMSVGAAGTVSGSPPDIR